MIRKISSTVDPRDCSKSAEKEGKKDDASRTRSHESTERDADTIERQPSPSEEYEDHGPNKRPPPRPSKELTRTTSNVLTRVSSHLTTHSLPDPGPPPDGGLKAWAQILCGWLAIITTRGWINCFGVFQTYYTLHLDVSPSAISWIGTSQNFLTFVLGALSGRMLDAGYFFPTAMAGVVLQLLGIFMMSQSTEYWQLLLTQGVLCGVGGGLFFTPCLGVPATWFSKRRSFAMGCASTGNSVGGMIYPVLVRELLPKLGFAWTVHVLGFMNMGLLAIVLALMRPRLPPRKSQALVDWSAFSEWPFSLFTIAITGHAAAKIPRMPTEMVLELLQPVSMHLLHLHVEQEALSLSSCPGSAAPGPSAVITLCLAPLMYEAYCFCDRELLLQST